MLADFELQELLATTQTVAIVGMSDRPDRDSHAVARFLQRNGYRIVPVNPNLTSPVLGEQPYASLKDIPFQVDVVDIFRRSETVASVVEEAIEIGAHTVWMQLGVVNVEVAKRAAAAGLKVVMNRCIAIEHRRLMRYTELVGK
jgi:predicted CoA-binding protein